MAEFARKLYISCLTSGECWLAHKVTCDQASLIFFVAAGRYA